MDRKGRVEERPSGCVGGGTAAAESPVGLRVAGPTVLLLLVEKEVFSRRESFRVKIMGYPTWRRVAGTKTNRSSCKGLPIAEPTALIESRYD